MKAMQQIAYDFLKEKKTATFKQVWDEVSKGRKASWKEEAKTISVPKIEEIKMGELYTMLTTNGQFIRNKDEKWTLSEFYSYDEVQKMKINAVELVVED